MAYRGAYTEVLFSPVKRLPEVKPKSLPEVPSQVDLNTIHHDSFALVMTYYIEALGIPPRLSIKRLNLNVQATVD